MRRGVEFKRCRRVDRGWTARSEAAALMAAAAILAPSPPAGAARPLPPATWVGEAPPPAPCLAKAPSDMVCVPGGPVVRGRDDGPANERPAMLLWLSTFYLDRNEVTFADYQACVRRGKCRPAKPIYSDFNRPRQPMVAVTYFDARRFCEAAGKRLPTEAEWEKGARGEHGDLYPWGNDPVTCERAVIEDARGRSCGLRKRGKPHLADKGRTLEVPARPAFRYGLHDMIGNSWEWVADWHADYGRCGAACRGIDPKGPCAGADHCPGHRQRVLRGGSWYWDAAHATGSYRRPYVPENVPVSHFGFRCAADVAQARRLVGPPGG